MKNLIVILFLLTPLFISAQTKRVGKWNCESNTSSMKFTVEILSNNTAIIDFGSAKTTEYLTKTVGDGWTKYKVKNNRYGEYYMVFRNGNMEMRDNQGTITGYQITPIK